MEPTQPAASGPAARRQRILAIVGALLIGACVPVQAFTLGTAAFVSRSYASMGLRHTAATATVDFVAAWRWPLLAVLLTAQAVAVVSAARRPAYGRRLLITGVVVLLVTALLYFLFLAPLVLDIVHHATSADLTAK
jgi:type II secretory pathway component PulM